MKYSGAKNEIVIESTRHPYEICNEISRAIFKNSTMKCCGYLLKIAMKYPGIHLKNCNESC
jgi:hypothetical protein